MKKNIFDILTERGFIKQTIYQEDLYKLLGSESVPFYVGFDPTADSLHIGHYIPIMAMAHMQAAGHKPIALIGGATAVIGDPSGRSDMRSIMTRETIADNANAFKEQMKRFIRFEGDNAALLVNNADWLNNLNFLEFMRDIGVNFSVNRMLSAECFKIRLETGLTFLEFSYMLMQAYDFLELYNKYGCKLQLGGNDQWSNMLAGVDLIRRKGREDAYCMTFALLETSDGRKMGKTAKGALWLDPNKTSPYEFYQYFRNIEDIKVAECLKLLTFVEMEEIAVLTAHMDERMNIAKERLAYEVTKLVHGGKAAAEAREMAAAAFGSGNAADMLTVDIEGGAAMSVVDLVTAAGGAKSKSEARRLIEGGGVTIDGVKAASVNATVSELTDKAEFVLEKGKKFRVLVKTV